MKKNIRTYGIVSFNGRDGFMCADCTVQHVSSSQWDVLRDVLLMDYRCHCAANYDGRGIELWCLCPGAPLQNHINYARTLAARVRIYAEYIVEKQQYLTRVARDAEGLRKYIADLLVIDDNLDALAY